MSGGVGEKEGETIDGGGDERDRHWRPRSLRLLAVASISPPAPTPAPGRPRQGQPRELQQPHHAHTDGVVARHGMPHPTAPSPHRSPTECMCRGQAPVLAVRGEAHGAVEHELGCDLRDSWSAKAAPARISHAVSGSLATTNQVRPMENTARVFWYIFIHATPKLTEVV